jgi:hypothetical protein
LRGWTYETLSKKMTDAGCSVAVSSLNRLERDHPPRRVNVDELMAFAAVFGVNFVEMMDPPEHYKTTLLFAWLDKYVNAAETIAQDRLEALRLESVRGDHTARLAPEEVRDAVREWASEQMFDADVAAALAAFLTGDATDSPLAPAITGSATSVPGAINILD